MNAAHRLFSISLCALAGVLLWCAPAPAAGLPDDRVYEMVTPLENHDADVYVPAQVGGEEAAIGTELPFEAAADGERVAYLGAPTVGGNASAGAGNGNEYLATRSPGGGWTQTNIQPAGSIGTIFEAFSSDLTVGILDSQQALAPNAPPGGYNVLYTTSTAGGGEYDPLFTVTPPYRSASEFEAAGVSEQAISFSEELAYAGASADMTHLLFEANDALTPAGEGLPAAEGGAAGHYEEENNLYESVGGRLRLVNVLPDGSTQAGATFGASAYEEEMYENPPDFGDVISADGSRVFWTDLHAGPNEEHIFVRENGTSTVAVSAGAARYWTATPDGEYAFYTEGGALYRFGVAGEAREPLTAAGAEVQGVVGVSEDGEYVYFVATGALAEGAVEGQPNLYLLHESGGVWVNPTLIATLSPEDNEVSPLTLGGFGTSGDWRPAVGRRTAEVTPDGHSVVFMSEESLTGYPNEGLQEVFVYDADTGGLSCASCDPSGAPPANPDGGAAAFLPVSFSATYQSRLISEDGGRVFFDSKEPLVGQDTNGKLDVYEWERDGAGSCAQGAGCVYLLSGGTSPAESYLVDASASGNDVFLVTRAQLVPQDENENYDLYDARVNGVVPLAPSVCTGSGCQGVPAAAPVFATPASVTFGGVGNFAASSGPAVTAKPKPKHKRKPKRGKRRRKRSARRRRRGLGASGRDRGHGKVGG